MRVGVLADSFLWGWQREALENINELDGVTITHVVIDESTERESSQKQSGTKAITDGKAVSMADIRFFVDSIRAEGLKAFIYADQKLGWLVFDEGRRSKYLQPRPTTEAEQLSDATITRCEPVPADGAWNTLPDDVVDTLAEESDVVIRFGFGLLKGRILTAPEHGVLSVHGSDIREYRGMGPKISFVNDDREVSVTLQQLSESIDGGRIVTIESKELPECHTLDDVLGAVNEIQTRIYASGIEKLRRDDFEPWEPEELGEYHGHDKQQKDVRFVTHLIAKNNYRRIKKLLT